MGKYVIKKTETGFNFSLYAVNKEKIAVSGHSLGSEAALFMSVLDDRVKALVFNDFVCDERRRWCEEISSINSSLNPSENRKEKSIHSSSGYSAVY